MFKSVNPYTELLKERSKHSTPVDVLAEVQQILRNEEVTEEDIRSRLKSKRVAPAQAVSVPEIGEVFTRQQIRTISINYRLRFLDADLFRGEFPYEVITKIKSLEKKHGIELNGFKVMAPVKMFSLIDPNADPLLFSTTGEGKYLFIHRWGNDMAWYRRWLAWPFRSFNTFLIFLVFLSAIVNICLPSEVIAPMAKYRSEEYNIRAFLLIHVFILLCGFSVFYFFSKGKGLSEMEWNNKYSR